MNRRNRTVGNELLAGGMHVITLFNYFIDKSLWVNRKYQRKLVWELEEKQSLVDTLLRGYPVPLFLFGKYKLDGSDKYCYEIVDGLQRLDAIFSFIMNEFPIKWEDEELYFDLSTLVGGNLLVENGTLKQQEPKLDSNLCFAFQNYLLSVTTVEYDDETIEDIFKRINSTGRKLSLQDLRQAGSLGDFSDLVRKTAAEIRGDGTLKDLLNLSEMKKVSISNNKLDYGIKINDIFWIKHDILIKNDIRLSRDEEIVARLYSYILKGSSVGVDKTTLDSMYNPENDLCNSLNLKVRELGQLALGTEFIEVYNLLSNCFSSVNSNFTDLLFEKRSTSGKSKIYMTLFLAVYELRKEGLTGVIFEDLAKILENLIPSNESKIPIALKHIVKDNSYGITIRNEAIKFFKNKIKSAFYHINLNEITDTDFDLKVRTALNLCANDGSEMQILDFKLGITNLKHGTLNKNVINKSIKTLTAMVNTDCQRTSMIIFGVADNSKMANEFEDFYGIHCNTIGNVAITGIDAEVKKFFSGDYNKYKETVVDTINHSSASDEMKIDVLSTIKFVKIYDKTVLVLQYKNPGKVVKYGGKVYVRYGNTIHDIDLSSDAFEDLVVKIHLSKA